MFHMTNDSKLFRTRKDLEEGEGAWPLGSNRYDSPRGKWLPLYEGKMVQAFDHRAAGIVIRPENRFRPAQPRPATLRQHQDPSWLPDPLYWVSEHDAEFRDAPCLFAFKDVTAPTNARSMIAAFAPRCGAGNTLPILSIEGQSCSSAAVLLANFNSIPFDFVARQKIQGQHLNWFVVEQLPVVPLDRCEAFRIGRKSAGDVVREAVLELTYTSHDMAPFAREMGWVDEMDGVRPPFPWDERRRASLRAKLDAVFFRLYGITDREDVRFVYSTFPQVESKETELYGRYRSRDLCLAYMNSFAAGMPDAPIRL